MKPFNIFSWQLLRSY